MTLSGTTGASINVSGTPIAAGPYAYSISVTGLTTRQVCGTYSGNIIPAVTSLTLNCTPTPGPTQVGVAYSATCTASGGSAPHNWSISSSCARAIAAESASVTGSSSVGADNAAR
ncbi:MAG TPA: hypothetical protein VKG86_07595 [Terracidiphilus sp.]|nr:hypothetical protein [Terracidiphilus sp.]